MQGSFSGATRGRRSRARGWGGRGRRAARDLRVAKNFVIFVLNVEKVVNFFSVFGAITFFFENALVCTQDSKESISPHFMRLRG